MLLQFYGSRYDVEYSVAEKYLGIYQNTQELDVEPAAVAVELLCWVNDVF